MIQSIVETLWSRQAGNGFMAGIQDARRVEVQACRKSAAIDASTDVGVHTRVGRRVSGGRHLNVAAYKYGIGSCRAALVAAGLVVPLIHRPVRVK